MLFYDYLSIYRHFLVSCGLSPPSPPWPNRMGGWGGTSPTEVSAGHELNLIFAKPKFTILSKCWLRYLVLYFICWDQHTINYVCLNFTTQKTGTQYQLLFPLRLNFSKNSEFWFCKNLVEFMSIISIFKTSVLKCCLKSCHRTVKLCMMTAHRTAK